MNTTLWLPFIGHIITEPDHLFNQPFCLLANLAVDRLAGDDRNWQHLTPCGQNPALIDVGEQA
ncbi:MAG: hypothetical protein KJ626_00005 [Verrucomicrobia bacterium]|nr:hypothetical protein [Verrucomicrobiota bacterium]